MSKTAEVNRWTFADLTVGQSAEVAKLITENMVIDFANVSGDHNPLHLDRGYAVTTPFKGRVAHGALIVSFVSGLIGTELPGPGAVAISMNLKFRKPVYLNSTVIIRVEITEMDSRRSFITLACVCKVEEEIVIKGEALVHFPQ